MPRKPIFTPWTDGRTAVAGAFRMGLAPIPVDAWLPPPDDAARRRRERDAVFAERPEAALACPADALPAARELAALIHAAVGAPAPGSGAADGPAAHDDPDENPLARCAALVPDDLCLLDAGADPGARSRTPPRLRAGVLTAPTGWRLDARLGQDLRALHGPVDGLDDAIGARMHDFLERLPPDRIFERGNWSLYDDDAYWRAEGDALGRIPPDLGNRPEVAEALFLRCERQTLRRLPETGWIVFTIRVHVLPITALADDAALAGTLRDAMRSLDATEARARRLDRVGAGLDAWLGGVVRGAPQGDRRCAV